ncbi:hypothetical protein VM1G_05871 [Cytospora mali]|uniref:Uncharacterized protein n=2 Tax=Cytospora mali TaxID=578113 RepID=A0A194W1U0_CYTMA|nr:hypothetical protein VP1G_05662 [Valsa mali var. pyri (nom. inval.)]KUI70429.1 hypothetical protein VM1G_05871 [Valsa mali]
MSTVEQVTTSATATAQGLIAADAKVTMAGKEPKEMKEQAAAILSTAMPTVGGCVEAIAKDPKQLEQNDPDVLGVQAVSLAAFGTPIGSTSSKRK